MPSRQERRQAARQAARDAGRQNERTSRNVQARLSHRRFSHCVTKQQSLADARIMMQRPGQVVEPTIRLSNVMILLVLTWLGSGPGHYRFRHQRDCRSSKTTKLELSVQIWFPRLSPPSGELPS